MQQLPVIGVSTTSHDVVKEDTYSSILAAGADGRPVFVEDEGKRDAGEGEEGGDHGSPMDAEVVVHLPGRFVLVWYEGENREGGKCRTL